ncbi:MAG: lysophospholipase, partial [Tannerella sp.]|nr:lysophospholipase [Tannerella sp.]
MNTRRNFLKKGVWGGLSLAMLPELAKAVVNEQNGVSAPKTGLKQNCVILFQGDSITDCGRKREATGSN